MTNTINTPTTLHRKLHEISKEFAFLFSVYYDEPEMVDFAYAMLGLMISTRRHIPKIDGVRYGASEIHALTSGKAYVGSAL